MFLRVTSALDTPAQATKLEGLRREEKKNRNRKQVILLKSRMNIDFPPSSLSFLDTTLEVGSSSTAKCQQK